MSGNGGNGAVIESHPTTVDSKPGTVSLNSVSGAGTTVTVMFSVTNNDKKNDMWIYDSFSDGDDSVPQPSGQTIALQATFTGVPADVKSVTISVPSGGTFSNVAVAR